MSIYIFVSVNKGGHWALRESYQFLALRKSQSKLFPMNFFKSFFNRGKERLGIRNDLLVQSV